MRGGPERRDLILRRLGVRAETGVPVSNPFQEFGVGDGYDYLASQVARGAPHCPNFGRAPACEDRNMQRGVPGPPGFGGVQICSFMRACRDKWENTGHGSCDITGREEAVWPNRVAPGRADARRR